MSDRSISSPEEDEAAVSSSLSSGNIQDEAEIHFQQEIKNIVSLDEKYQKNLMVYSVVDDTGSEDQGNNETEEEESRSSFTDLTRFLSIKQV